MRLPHCVFTACLLALIAVILARLKRGPKEAEELEKTAGSE